MISIAIPLYNKAQSIRNTIKCIQDQTFQDFEIIVVDGWSKDGSTEIIKDLAAEDPRIKVHMQKDRHGVTPARNESIEAASSEIVAFLDADDYWEPSYLETLIGLINDYPEAGIWGLAYGEMSENGKSGYAGNVAAGFRGMIEDPWPTVGCPYWTGATAVSKRAFNAVGGFDNNIIYGEDIDLWYRIMLKFPAAFDASSVLSFYRTDAENRACAHVFPLKIHLPYHIGKYAEARRENVAFRRFFDLQCLYRLFPYAGEREYRKDLHGILKQIDFSLQKPSMRLRFIFPRLYKLHQQRQGRAEKKMDIYQGGSKDKQV